MIYNIRSDYFSADFGQPEVDVKMIQNGDLTPKLNKKAIDSLGIIIRFNK